MKKSEPAMSTLLYLQASPRIERSYSIRTANAFVDAYRKIHPEDRIVTRNVFEMNLIAFDGLAVQAKYSILHGQSPSAEEKNAWKAVEGCIAEFTAADKYVFAVPMWNFGIPYRLKQYLDILVQPGYTFRFSPTEGYKGLVAGKPACLCYARGGDYSSPQAASSDFQKQYMEYILGFIGFTRFHSVIVEPTLAGGPQTAQQKLQQAIELAQTIAKTF